MSNIKKLMMSAAGGEALNVEDVFSTYLYEGNATARSITNGIDLDGEGGLVWIKARSTTGHNHLADTERGGNKWIYSNLTSGQDTVAYIPSFNSNGFDLNTSNAINANGTDYVSWTFRKAPKFFDVVTYTGNGTQGRTVSHNLGSAPGFIVVKKTSSTGNWPVYHRGMTSALYGMQLNSTTDQFDADSYWDSTDPTDSVFTLGNNADVNQSGATYVAYIFAHNDGDGEFGPDGDADIIKCGSYTGNGSVQDIDLGFEAQWVLVKNITSSNSTASRWGIYDVMRGMPPSNTYGAVELNPNTSASERTGFSSIIPYANGFTLLHGVTMNNQSSNNYIYMAIRRGSLFPPESGTEVFNVDITATAASGATPSYVSGFPVDMGLYRRRSTTAFWSTSSRLTQGRGLSTTSTDAEYGDPEMQFDYMTGWKQQDGYALADQTAWMWKRAPGYFDVVAYKGNGTAGRTVSHNLGVAPEMMWVKKRNVAGGNWIVYHSKLNVNSDNAPETDYIVLNGSSGADDYIGMWNDTAPTVSNFTLGSYQEINNNNDTFIAYLFASLPGVSKVGSYTGNGSSQTINCDFTSGARFILIKRTDNSGDWYIWDSVRGITAGSDPHLALNTTAAELTYRDSIDPANSGFIVNETANSNINVSSASYIFYAIA